MYTWKKENCLSEPENVSYKSLSGRLGETDLTSEIIEEPERASTLYCTYLCSPRDPEPPFDTVGKGERRSATKLTR
jgi:hypothetical protein